MTTLKRNMKEKDALLKDGQEENERLKKELKNKEAEILRIAIKPKKIEKAL
jgi:hypothetical protein